MFPPNPQEMGEGESDSWAVGLRSVFSVAKTPIRCLDMRNRRSITRLPAPRALLPLSFLAVLNCAEPTPSPTFELSGVIEGFYGPPWSHGDRLDILRFMGGVGLDVYIYAPKDDPFHRSRWRDPYPEDERQQLQELVVTAQQAGVEFWYAISPGLTITYSDSTDYRDLVHKIDQVADLGVEHFGLFVDDVPPQLTHDADREAFGTLARAHVALTNKLHEHLAARGQTLALTPTTYTNAWGDLEYLAEIGAGVAQEVTILWTGPDVASPTISAAQASDWGRLLQRKPLLWDNYPVNDYARWRLFLGPFTGRAADLAGATLGIIANPMNEAHASMIPLATLADYARDPSGYDPRQSLGGALEMLYGEDAEALNPFVGVFGDYGWDENLFEPLYILSDTIYVAPIEDALTQLQTALTDLERSSATNGALRALRDELEPFATRQRERLAELGRSRAYEERNGLLVYRSELDRIVAAQTTTSVVVDGNLSEWRNADWRPLYRSGQSTDIRVAFRRDDEFLYLAIATQYRNIRVRGGLMLGEADHIAIVIDGDPMDGAIGKDDLFVLLPPPNNIANAEPVVTALPFEGFMAKWLADNHALTFTEFHLSTFGSDPSPVVAPMADGLKYGTRRTRTGYSAELALPHLGRDRLRLSLTVTYTSGGRRVASLSRRNYPANPTTFAEIRLNH